VVAVRFIALAQEAGENICLIVLCHCGAPSHAHCRISCDSVCSERYWHVGSRLAHLGMRARYHLGWPGACWLNLLTQHKATGLIQIYTLALACEASCVSLRVYFAGWAAEEDRGCGNAHQSMLYARDSQEYERHKSHSFFFWLAASISCFSATGSLNHRCILCDAMPSEHYDSGGSHSRWKQQCHIILFQTVQWCSLHQAWK